MSEATRRVLEATGVDFHWEMAKAGEEAQKKFDTPLPKSVIESIRKNRVALKGPITTPVGSGFRSVNVALRKSMNLYACVRPCKIYPGAPTQFKDVDIVVVRENTEDLYIGIEFEQGTPETGKLLELVSATTGDIIARDSGVSLKTISEAGSRYDK